MKVIVKFNINILPLNLTTLIDAYGYKHQNFDSTNLDN